MRCAIHHFVAPALVLSLAALLLPSPCTATLEWEPVPDSLLTLKKSTFDPGADSEISSMRVTVEDFEDRVTVVNRSTPSSIPYLTKLPVATSRRLDHFVCVKVFDARGAERWSRIVVEIPDTSVKISHFEVRTVLPDGTVLPVGVTTGAIQTVYDERNRPVRRWSFATRGVCPGSVMVYRYHEERRGGRLLRGYLPLQFDVPVRDVSYQITTPLTGMPLAFNYVTFHSRPRIVIDEIHNRYEIAAHDQPAFRQEPDVLPEMTQRAGVLVYYAAKSKVEPAEFWPAIGRPRAEAFEGLSRPNGFIRGIVRDSIAAGPAAPVAERLKAIVEWCRSRIRVVPDNPDSLARPRVNLDADGPEVVHARAGTAWGVNLAFAALCRAAGFEVRYLVAGSHGDVFFQQDWMSLDFLPAQETAVRVGSKWLAFSPQSRYLAWDMLPAEEEGDYALLCDRDSTCFIIDPLSPPGASVATKSLDLRLQPDGSLTGMLLLEFSGHFNDRLRSDLEPGDESLEAVIRGQNLWDEADAEVTRIESANMNHPGEPLRVQARIHIRNHAVRGARRLLLEPAVMRAHRAPRFKAGIRTFPIYFDFAHAERDTVRIHLDGKWELEQAEQLRPIAAGGLGRYAATVNVDASGSTITYVRSLSLALDGRLNYPVAAYEDIRAFFDAVQKRDRVKLGLVPAGGAQP